MKAVVRDVYGSPDVLRYEEIEVPVPRDEEVIVRVRASSLNRADRYALEGTPRLIRLVTGWRRPNKRGMGMDFAGDVEQVGDRVPDVVPGQAVYGQVDFGETWAEYARVPAKLVAPRPTNLSYEEAAAVPLSALTALQGLRDKARVTAGQHVLVNGATGAVGTYAVQIAKAFGAEVTGVCSARNAALVRSLGADHVVAYETDDFTTLDRRFDVLFDVAGSRSPRRCGRVMERRGTIVLVGAPDDGWLGPVGHLLGASLQGFLVPQRVVSLTARPNRPDLLVLTELLESGEVRPVIDRTFELAQAAEAMRYLRDGRPPAKVVLRV